MTSPAKQVQRTIRSGHNFVVDMDLSKFFDKVQHDVLMNRVARKVRDKRLLGLIGRYLRAGVMVEGVLQSSPDGTPQGGPLSPLLANILLDDLDKELEKRGLPFVRYADDFVIFTRSRRAAERVFEGVICYLTKVLRLVVNQEKSRIVPVDGVEFLGFVFRGPRKGAIHVSEKNVQKFKRRIRKLTGRSRGISMTQRLGALCRYLNGWAGYFALAMQKPLFESFDKWIRRRLRMCLWKSWRFVRTRFRNLVALGVSRQAASLHARSRKGPWRMSRTLASSVGLTNDWLQSQGLVSLLSLWIKRAPLRRIASFGPARYVVWGAGGESRLPTRFGMS
jgi:RNA-directed DNA polymerase